MTKYRKKPVVIEAEQYKEGMEDEFAENHIIKMIPYIKNQNDCLMYFISNGDWIITEVNGRRSTCNPDIFEATYEMVE